MSLDFVILGAQKAATSSLQAALRRVPGIFMPPGESAFFEDPEFASSPWVRFGEDSTVNGIKRPDNLCREDLLERVALNVPDARFLVVLRDPISRAISAYYHLVRHGRLPVLPLNDGMRSALSAHRTGSTSALASVIQFGLYGRYLRLWFDRLPQNQFLILSQTSIVADFDQTLRACCEHLGVGYTSSIDDQSTSENIGLYDERYLTLFHRGHRLKTRSVPGTERREPSKNIASRAIGQSMVVAAQRRANPAARPPKLATDVRAALVEIYGPDLETLQTLVDPTAVDWSFTTDGV